MKQVVRSVYEKQYLKLALDYELASLYDAMQSNDQEVISKSKARLGQIRKELLVFGEFSNTTAQKIGDPIVQGADIPAVIAEISKDSTFNLPRRKFLDILFSDKYTMGEVDKEDEE